MNNDKLQRMVENLSEEKFGRTFQHRAYFNKRLRTTGGRYLLKSHDIEINPKQYEHYGEDAVVKIILHELCH
ncbi:SprT family protein, partial [Staphylococcus aureus]